MKTEFFIAKRILKGSKADGRFSRPIVLFATIGIALGIIVMMLSISIVTGFRSEIKNKVVGFGSHINITNGGINYSSESSPINKQQFFLPLLDTLPEVKHIQSYAIKPGLLQSKGDSTLVNGTLKFQKQIQGIIVKGIDQNYDWDFFESKLLSGSVPDLGSAKPTDTILVSKYQADILHIGVNDKIATYFIKENGPKEKKFIVGGIYETGLEEFDKQFVFADIRHIQQINLWGIKNAIYLNPEPVSNSLVVEALCFSNAETIRHKWNDFGFDLRTKMLIRPTKDTIIQLVSSSFTKGSFGEDTEMLLTPDTSTLEIKFTGIPDLSTISEMEISALNDSTNEYLFEGGKITTILHADNGSRNDYVGGYEIILHNYDRLDEISELVKDETFTMFTVESIKDSHPEIFGWLEMLDTNVYVIMILMILVAIINMTAALLILILERTNMIGVLKALGAGNFSIQKVFLINGAYLIGKGLLWGNAIALLIIFLQNKLGFIQLSQETYFLKEVPMYFTGWYFILLNLGTLIVCTLALVIPSFFVSKITPVKALKFD